jgi:hypothetical protein
MVPAQAEFVVSSIRNDSPARLDLANAALTSLWEASDSYAADDDSLSREIELGELLDGMPSGVAGFA